MHNPFLADLAIVLGVAAVTAVIARLLKQPTILGYLLAGLIVGPYLGVPIFADPVRVHTMAEFGVILVMFAIGLEFRVARLIAILPVAGLTGLVQIATLIWAGVSVAQILGWNTVESLFLGTGIAISSTMVVTKVFEQRPVERDIRELVLGILVVQDVVAIILIAAMTAVAKGGGMSAGELVETLGGLGAVLIGLVVGGMLIVPRLMRAVVRLDNAEILVVVTVGLCFGVALLAQELGYSVALGAFIAGIVVAESGESLKVEHHIQPVRDMFAAIFFVSVGMSVDPFVAFDHLPTALVLFVIVVVAQLMSVTIAGIVSGNGLRRSVTAGLALGQIGEFGFILATIGISAGVAPPYLQSILVTVAILTAFSTPHMLGLSDRLVRGLDHILPHRVQRLIALYDAWIDRLRLQRTKPRKRLYRVLAALIFDAVVLLVLIGLTIAWLPTLATWGAEVVGIDHQLAAVLIGLVAVLVAVPLMAGLVRNTLALARILSETVLQPEMTAPGPAERVAAHVIRGMIYLGVVAGVGFPTIAVLRPLTGQLYGMLLLAAAFIAVGVYLWRGAGAFATELATGAEHLANLLARQAAGDTPPPAPAQELLLGLDEAAVFTIASDAPCAGHTLTELQLRSRTGADVVAIHRPGAPVLLPTGHEQLLAGDIIAVYGSADAIRRARVLLEPAHAIVPADLDTPDIEAPIADA